jgi:multisubunit Na+/H+ antiporter MnhG subunit
MSERPPSITRTYASYLGIRLVLFAAALVICIVLGMNGVLAVLVALLVSGVVAYPLARRQRDEIARAFQHRRGGR